MSKSIYEETLTELEMWRSTEALDQEQLEKIDEHIEVMKKAIKQEKLLELYKELSNYVDEITYAHELPEITRLKILIKELENDKR